MSITLTVRTHGAEGTTTTPPPVDGDSSNGFNQGEIDRILATMPNDDDTVVIPGVNSGNPMTKAQVRALLTTNPETAAPPAADPAADLPAPEPRDSGLLSVGGWFRYVIGGHGGPSGGLEFTREWATHPNARLRLGGVVLGQSLSRTYSLPGSAEGANDANSTFNAVGAGGFFGARFPVAAQNRFFLSSDVMLALMGAWTPSSTTGTLAGGGGEVCYDAGGGRQQCEERAGATGNLGTTGGFDPRVGNSVGQSGLGIDLALRLGLGYMIPISASSLSIDGGVDLGLFNTFTGVGAQTTPYVAPRLGIRYDW